MLVGAFNHEKALVGVFSVIVKTGCGTDGSFYSTTKPRLMTRDLNAAAASDVGRGSAGRRRLLFNTPELKCTGWKIT